MRISRTKISTMTGIVAVLAACIPCCLPLIMPILADLSMTSFAAFLTGWHFAAIGAFVVGAGAYMAIRFWRSARCSAPSVTSSCGCNSACQP